MLHRNQSLVDCGQRTLRQQWGQPRNSSSSFLCGGSYRQPVGTNYPQAVLLEEPLFREQEIQTIDFQALPIYLEPKMVKYAGFSLRAVEQQKLETKFNSIYFKEHTAKIISKIVVAANEMLSQKTGRISKDIIKRIVINTHFTAFLGKTQFRSKNSQTAPQQSDGQESSRPSANSCLGIAKL